MSLTPEDRELYQQIREFQRHAGPQMAVHVAKIFGVTVEKVGQLCLSGEADELTENHRLWRELEIREHAVYEAARAKRIRREADIKAMSLEELALDPGTDARYEERERERKRLRDKVAATFKAREEKRLATLVDGAEARNQAIYKDRLKGLTYRKLGEKYGLSPHRTNQIVAKEHRRARGLYALRLSKMMQGAYYPFNDPYNVWIEATPSDVWRDRFPGLPGHH